MVLACVRDDEAARAVWLDDERGAVQGLAAGALAIDSSTLTPDTVRELDAALREAGARFVEAPVVGSRPQAEARALVHLVGAREADFAAAQPVLARLGKAAHHLGAPGDGAVMKLAVNAYFATQAAALGELLGFAARAGVGAERACPPGRVRIGGERVERARGRRALEQGDRTGALVRLAEHDVLGGLDLRADHPELGNALLVCATETKTDEDIERYRALLAEVMNEQGSLASAG